jgi:glycosyltransferase involved in cell wall biosynthesis
MSLTHLPVKRLAIISNQAFSLLNFRGPLIKELISRGVQVFTLAPDFDEQSRAALKDLGAEPVDYSLSRVGMNPIRDLSDIVCLIRLLKMIEPEIALSYFAKPVIYGTLAARFASVPRSYAIVEGLGFAFTEDGTANLKKRLIRMVLYQMYRLAFTSANKVFFLNNDDIEEFQHKKLVKPGKALNLGGIGVDLAQWSPVPLVNSPPVYLLVARLLREKGIHDFVEAARQVKERHPQARFLLVGGVDLNPGSLTETELETWVKQGIIEWHGHCNDVRSWISQANVFVLPSYREGLPRSTQEAMAMGRAVITTDVVGCRETVVHGANGFLVPVRDPAALATAMETFIHNPDLIESMGKNSRRLAEERFDVHKINANIIQAMGL